MLRLVAYPKDLFIIIIIIIIIVTIIYHYHYMIIIIIIIIISITISRSRSSSSSSSNSSNSNSNTNAAAVLSLSSSLSREFRQHDLTGLFVLCKKFQNWNCQTKKACESSQCEIQLDYLYIHATLSHHARHKHVWSDTTRRVMTVASKGTIGNYLGGMGLLLGLLSAVNELGG